MSRRSLGPIAPLALALAGAMPGGPAAAQRALPTALDGKPDAIVDLRTAEGVRLVRGEWRYSDARLVEIDSKGPGADLRATGAPIRTYDYVPKAGAAEFDDSGWEAVEPELLETRRGTGRFSFNWYRIAITVPERVGGFDTTGSTAVLEIVVDDYAETWVNGRLPRVLGQQGGALIGGFNTPNRIVLGRDLKPGERIQVAVFGANGPLSDPPPNFIWIRSATIDFYGGARVNAAHEVETTIERLDPAFDTIVPPGSAIQKLADGFDFVEGPVWVPEGYLLFSDPNRNTIYRWTPGEGLSVFRTKSGYTGPDVAAYGQPGSNGLALDREGRLTINEHGNRRVTRLEKNGVLTVLADRFDGRRLNSPNDLVYRSDGSLYFTDPPFGLPKFFDDPRKELPFSGIFRFDGSRVKLVSAELTGPNGLAFSPDEKYLYVGNWDVKKKVVMRYEVNPDGTLSKGAVFFDMTSAPGEEALDGLKIDQRGNLYVSGPGGLWIISAEGKHLGTLKGPELAANFAWGDADRRTLYLTARTGLYRIRLNVPGAGSLPGGTHD